MDQWYQIMLYLHALAVLTRLAAAGVTVLALVWMPFASTQVAMRRVERMLILGERSVPASLLVLVLSGAGLVIRGSRYAWSDGWVVGSLALIVAIGILAAVQWRPLLRRLSAAVSQGSGEDARREVLAEYPCYLSAGGSVLAGLALLMYLMVIRPGSGVTASTIVGLAVVVAAAQAVALRTRTHRAGRARSYG